ncbi:hypothetical protein [Rothia uropygioeca]|nr:hypothetical protein [Kocuria sp. 257]
MTRSNQKSWPAGTVIKQIVDNNGVNGFGAQRSGSNGARPWLDEPFTS